MSDVVTHFFVPRLPDDSVRSRVWDLRCPSLPTNRWAPRLASSLGLPVGLRGWTVAISCTVSAVFPCCSSSHRRAELWRLVAKSPTHWFSGKDLLWNDPIASDLIGIDDLVIRQDIFLFLFKMFRLYFIVLDFFKPAQHIVNNIYIYS